LTYQLIQAPANKIPLPDESVQCVVTSPPYWGLRKYDGAQDLLWGGSSLCEHDFQESINFDNSKKGNEGSTTASNPGHEVSDRFKSVSGTCSLCGAWRGGFGLEPSLKLYIEHTVEILRELKRILKPDGVVFWNVGDSYAGGGNYRGLSSEKTLTSKQASNRGAKGIHQELGALGKDSGTAKPKDLCLIPQRVAIAAQEDGWWVRQDIIWNKPNPMPESVRDRFTDAYEHIFMFTKSQKYFWDPEACQEPAEMAGKYAECLDFRDPTIQRSAFRYLSRRTPPPLHPGSNQNRRHRIGPILRVGYNRKSCTGTWPKFYRDRPRIPRISRTENSEGGSARN
jgi:DNA modification methylase